MYVSIPSMLMTLPDGFPSQMGLGDDESQHGWILPDMVGIDEAIEKEACSKMFMIS